MGGLGREKVTLLSSHGGKGEGKTSFSPSPTGLIELESDAWQKACLANYPEGILPIAKRFGLENEWELPGKGEAYSDCGDLRFEGCLETEKHNQQQLDNVDTIGKAYVHSYKRSCGRASCPTCSSKWSSMEAHKISHRIRAFKLKGRKLRAIHLIVSCNSKEAYTLDYLQLRRKCYVVSKKSGFIGGCCIFHHLRYDRSISEWYYSPHFHLLGYGWIRKTKEGYERHGWVVKNAGVRKSISGTAVYQLSHAGIHSRYHSITWFGALSYYKLKVAKLLMKKNVCPICGGELRPLMFVGDIVFFNNMAKSEGFFWLDDVGWLYD